MYADFTVLDKALRHLICARPLVTLRTTTITHRLGHCVLSSFQKCPHQDLLYGTHWMATLQRNLLQSWQC
jgi:hypothetical protein